MERELIKYIYQEELYDLSQNKSEDNPPIKSSSHKESSKLTVLINDSLGNEKELFEKILSAIHLTFEEINLIEFKEPIEYNLKNIESNMILTFGVKLSQGYPLYTISKSENKVILSSESLKELNMDATNNKKRKLWKGLKELFS